jgi:hypothetical protein
LTVTLLSGLLTLEIVSATGDSWLNQRQGEGKGWNRVFVLPAEPRGETLKGIRFALKRTTLFYSTTSKRTKQVLSGQEVKAVDGYEGGGEAILVCEFSDDAECFQADISYNDVIPVGV